VQVAAAIDDQLGTQDVEDAEDERGGAHQDGDDGQQAANDEGEHAAAGPRSTVVAT
jgi:hypothetical protein